MALFDEALVREITGLVRKRYEELGAALGEQSEQEGSSKLDESSVLQRDVRLLIGVANGEYRRTDALVREIEMVLTRLMDLLLGNALRGRATMPDDFWHTDIGMHIIPLQK
jgi:hypothetical protein